MERVVIVTGVSTGIGNATARVLLRGGYRVFGSVRRTADADRLATEWGAAFAPLIFDVTRHDEVVRGAQEARRLLGRGRVVGLVNNAGIAVAGPLLELPLEALRMQLEVNLVGVLAVTQAFMPLLREAREQADRRPRIINISSISARLALPFLGAYTAAKHGLEGLSDTLRRELICEGVDVIKIDPGNVATSIYDKVDAMDASAYAESRYFHALQQSRAMMVAKGRRGSPPERVGRFVQRVLETRNPRTSYVMPSGMPLWMAQLVLPARPADRLIAATMGLQRRGQGKCRSVGAAKK